MRGRPTICWAAASKPRTSNGVAGDGQHQEAETAARHRIAAGTWAENDGERDMLPLQFKPHRYTEWEPRLSVDG